MKILYLSDDFPPEVLGGAGIIAHQEAIAMSKLGHEIAIITTTRDLNKCGTFVENGLKVHRLYSSYAERWRAYISINNRKVVKQISQIINEFKPDIVHAHNIHSHISYAGLKVAKNSGARVLLTFHDLMAVSYGKVIKGSMSISDIGFRYNPFRNFFIKKYLGYADKLLAVSEAVSSILSNNGIKNIAVIHNGIEVRDWAIDEVKLKAFKSRLNLADTRFNLEGKKVIFFVGRISGAKGAFVALEALKKVRESSDNAVLLIAGSSDSKGAMKMKERAHELNLEDAVIFTGWLAHEEMKYAISAADIVAVLSLYVDPFPTVNLEAMACKKPVIGTKFGGTPEIVMDNVTGYIVDPGDVKETAIKMVGLLANDARANEFGNAGYERVKKDFSLDEHVKSLLKWYDKRNE